MAALLVEGETLGQKHRNYNNLVNEAIKNDPTQQITSLNYEEPDLDNLYKIDIACNNRNVEYILEALKCEDMLYVSRVIKQSIWLITDNRYSSIINPEYLYNSLCPHMTSKAFNKLLLNIRLHLGDENRVEGFFNYHKKRDLQKALKWLPRCSIPFIKIIIEKHADDIPDQILKRLYEKSISFLETFIRSYKSHYKRDKILLAMFLVKKNVEKFLDIIEATDMNDIPSFGQKNTKKVMEICPERIMKNIEKYVHIVDLSIFAKYIRNEDAKNFILTHIKNKNMQWWFVHKNIKHFLNRLPTEERFDFIKSFFIEKSYKDENFIDETWDDVVDQCNPRIRENASSSINIYSWYVYAPFDRAFEDLKQLILNESNPTERICIFNVMLTCAGSDKHNVLKLLKYYREHHINEPFKFKIQFVNSLLTKTDTHKYDKEAWGYLNDLFKSMEVYINSDKNVQLCVRSVILHNVIKGENVPEIIQNKFEFENLDNKIKFDTEEREKIFNFLYKYLILKISNDLKTEKEFNETVDHVVKVLNILKDWNKELKDYPCILQKIKDLIYARKENSWNRDLSDIYNIKISWRKLLLAESIILYPTEDSYINALKHDPQLLEIYSEEINKLCIQKNMVFVRFLKKIRVYFYQSLSECFKTIFLENLDQRSSHFMSIKGLCTLFSRKEILEFIQKYVPSESKIDWSQPDEFELNLRKYITKNMHLARPQPPLAVVLLYAKGDYLQYVMPSLNAILYNISATYIGNHLPELLNTPVSLQQHCIRAAFSKLKHTELKNTFLDLWKSNKNITIRTVIFCQTYNMLCKETNETVISEIWELLSVFVEKLTSNENKKIYLTLSKAKKVPQSVRAAFWMKSYDFLTKLPVTANCATLLDDLRSQMNEIMESLDVDFMAQVCFENFDKKFTTQQYYYSYQVSLYLLSTKTETAQSERYEKILLPILEKSIAMWDKQHENVYYVRCNLSDIFANMSREFENVVLNKNMMFPISMYTLALNKLKSNLSIIETYTLITNIKISLGYIQILHDLKTKMNIGICSENVNLYQKDVWKDLHAQAAPIFGKLCLDYLKEDVANHFPSIYIIFADVLDTVIDRYMNQYHKLVILKAIIDSKDFIHRHLLVLNLMPSYLYEDDEKALKLEILNEISSHPSEEVAMHYWLLQTKE